ncbi:MAG: hypothetical protein ACLQGT_14965 [Terracidiphilus sp.]
MRQHSLAFLTAGFLLAASPAFAATFTGTVSDTMCGKSHSSMGTSMSAADCTRACVKAGASYALVTSDKVYGLKADKAQLDQLDKFAGAKVVIDGDPSGTIITIKTVKADK